MTEDQIQPSAEEMLYTPQPTTPIEQENGFVAGMKWVLKGFVFPLWSLNFYRQSTRKNVILGIRFLLLFAILETAIINIRGYPNLKLIEEKLISEYNTEIFPLIIVIAIVVYFWSSIVRLPYIITICLLMWGTVSIFRKDVKLDAIMMVGILANVPTVYIIFILNQFGVQFSRMHTLVFGIIWTIVLVALFRSQDPGALLKQEEQVTAG